MCRINLNFFLSLFRLQLVCALAFTAADAKAQTPYLGEVVQNPFPQIDNKIKDHQYADALKLAYNLVDSSQTANYAEGVAWGEYYLGIGYYYIDQHDSAYVYTEKSHQHFTQNQNALGEFRTLYLSALLYHYLPNYDSAISQLDRAENLIHTELKDSSLLIDTYRAKGNNLSYIGEHNSALEYLLKALQIAQDTKNNEKAANIYNNLGILMSNWGDLPKALEYHYTALRMFYQLNYPTGIAYQHNNVGHLLVELGDFYNALDHLQKSLAIKDSLNDIRGMSNTLLNIGRVHLEANRYHTALTFFDRAAELKQQINDPTGVATIYDLKGRVYREIQHYDLSLKFLNDALRNYHTLGTTLDSVQTMIQQALTYIAMQNFGMAKKILAKVSETNKDQVPLVTTQLYKAYYELYKSQHNDTKALQYFTKYIELRDSVVNVDNLKKALSMQTQLDYSNIIKQHFERSNIKVQKAEASTSKYRQLVGLLSIALIPTIVLVIVLVYSTRSRKKANENLAQQQAETLKQMDELKRIHNDLEITKNMVIYQRDKIITMIQDLGESINYARLIQQAMLPTVEVMRKNFSEYFVLNRPKEAVGGDFYWTGLTNTEHLVFVVADSTGHGVPGGFMSMLCLSKINEVIARNLCQTPAEALNELRNNIIDTLNQHGADTDSTDGMDIAFCSYHPETKQLMYAGANLPIIVSTQKPIETTKRIEQLGDGLYEISPDRMPISWYDPMEPFKTIEIPINPGDTVYLFTDGYIDQFGGTMYKKFGHRALRRLIKSVQNLNIEEQKQKIQDTLEQWKGVTNTQTDDILMMAVKLK